MPRRIALLIVGGLLLAGAAVLAIWTTRAGGAPQPGAERRGPVAGTGPARILLNEVVFEPAAGEPQWVEILNAGGEAGTLDGLVLENQAGARFPLPSPFRLEAGAVHVVRFPATFLAPEGFVQLAGTKDKLDRIAWGKGQGRAASLSRGAYREKLIPGTSIGRVPQSIESDPESWVPYRPAQATPGRPNPRAAVEILLPVDRAVVMTATPDLTWYTVAGSARYRVQLSAESSFGSTLFDRTVAAPPVKMPALAPGTYVWRVQAIASDGGAAEYSPANQLTVRAAPARRGALLDWLLPRLHAQPSAPTVDDELPIVLDVPLIRQHKDTAMLLLETPRESGQHAWDVDHREGDPTDRADNRNSVAACVAMLAKYYGGNLSQDRINYEIFGKDSPFPEWDFNWHGTYDETLLLLAMGFGFLQGEAQVYLDTFDREPDESDRARRRAYIKAGVPSIACKNQHCMAVVGFGGRDNLVVLNDPAIGTYLVPLSFFIGAREFSLIASETRRGDHFEIETIRTSGRVDEPEISTDSDGDGVVDFDEIRRFRTNPRAKDSDADELPDKEDIKASVFDPREGYAHGGQGRDMDGDGTPMELDDDSDDGGCLDGWEDVNKNGRFDSGAGETNNFQVDDDPCLSGSFTNNADLVKPPGGNQLRYEFQQRHNARFSMRRGPDGVTRGRGRVHFDERIASGIVSEQAECRYSMIVGPVDWTVELTAETTTLSDGNLQVSLRASPEKGPSFDSVATNRGPALCGPFSTTVTSQGHPWPMLGPYTLTNGIFRHLYSPPLPPGTTGSIVSEVVVKMNGNRR